MEDKQFPFREVTPVQGSQLQLLWMTVGGKKTMNAKKKKGEEEEKKEAMLKVEWMWWIWNDTSSSSWKTKMSQTEA